MTGALGARASALLRGDSARHCKSCTKVDAVRVDIGRLNQMLEARSLDFDNRILGLHIHPVPSSSFTKNRSVCCPVSSGAGKAGYSKWLLALCEECI